MSSIYTAFNNFVTSIERTVTLVYPEKKSPCDNCYLDTMGTRARSISIYKVGGPMPFENGQPCPYCDGKGYKAVEQTEDINTRIYIDQKSWIIKGMSLRLPAGSLELVTKIEYTNQLKMAKYLIPKYNGLQDYQSEKYFRVEGVFSSSWVLNPQKYVNSYWSTNEKNQ